ncbi:hypothetical protein ACHAC9_16040 [Massilia sp. CMS3.1]|uniref:hypothetical protein n=1 Tax=Massilia sp. CMS3.1 TaxID=3373083 RepID=UPI003EE551A2
MDEQNALASSTAQVIGVKSWLAYAGVLALAVILFGVLLPLAFLWHDMAALAVLLLSALLVAYEFLHVRSVQLYMDELGVWVHSGVLPWKQGITGVKWRDMDEATYVNGFRSWATRSYTVRVKHRFTQDSEIVLTNIAGGKGAVAIVNARHQALIRTGSVD